MSVMIGSTDRVKSITPLGTLTPSATSLIMTEKNDCKVLLLLQYLIQDNKKYKCTKRYDNATTEAQGRSRGIGWNNWKEWRSRGMKKLLYGWKSQIRDGGKEG